MALQTRLTANINRSEKTPPFNDLAPFLPHPATWKRETEERKVNISRACAIEFLSTYQKFDPAIEALFDDWLSEIKLIASGA